MTVVAENWEEYLIIEYRWVLVITALLPLSLIWKVWSTIRNYVIFKMRSAPKMHDKKVKEVQRQVKDSYISCTAILKQYIVYFL